ncbi:MAG: global cell cycle regulator GcrA-like protein [Alphaproteobacteria bacterium]|mgnify:CR=1 FL=1|jgi:GcrA cell cycle regulator|nr:global cell cycle regulator GcrA-like protein [Alphaproteobacteria bacterium]
MSWTPERIAKLEELWAEGLSTAEIGRRLGVSKNAVVGKAHRMKLPGRQSPIESKRKAKPAAAKAPAAAAAKPKPAAKPAAAAKPAPKKAAAKAAPEPSPEAAKTKADHQKTKQKRSGPVCQWPIGDPRLPGFHFCTDEATPGKPYCEHHCSIAYNRPSSSSSEAKAA